MGNYWRHRTWCDTIEEMRQCYKTLNFGYMNSLIEELASHGSRMEAGLSDKKDLITMSEDWTKAKKKLKDIEKKIEKVEKKAEKLGIKVEKNNEKTENPLGL